MRALGCGDAGPVAGRAGDVRARVTMRRRRSGWDMVIPGTGQARPNAAGGAFSRGE